MKLSLRGRITSVSLLVLACFAAVAAVSWRRSNQTIAYLENVGRLSAGMRALNDRIHGSMDTATVNALVARREAGRVIMARWNQELADVARKTHLTVEVMVILTVLVGAAGAVLIFRELRAREQAERAREAQRVLLRDAHNELADLYDYAPCGYHSTGPDGLILRMNDTELRWLGYTREEVVGRMHITDLLTPATRAEFPETFRRFRERGELRDIQTEYVRKDGTLLPVLVSATALRDADGKLVLTRTVVTDITDLWHTRMELEAVVGELEQAMASIRTLKGLLPMCSVCHKVRDDSGYWERIEKYVSEHTEAQVSHGVCPTCFPTLYPDVELEEAID